MKHLLEKLMLLLLGSSIQFLNAQTSIVGNWNISKEESGNVLGVIEIKESNGVYSGKVVFITEGESQVCDQCSEHKEVLGKEVIWGLKKKGGVYTDGTLLNVENGNEYDCELWVEDGFLMVRGYLGFLYKTLKWSATDVEQLAIK